MQYTTTISAAAVYGITAARAAYNAALPATVREGEADLPNPALLAHDTAYLDFVLRNAIESWCRQYAPVVVPDVPPVAVGGVPASVTMRQAQLALLGAGLLGAVEAAIATIPGDAGLAARITWEKSSSVERTNPLIGQLAAALGLSGAQLDALFIAAAKL